MKSFILTYINIQLDVIYIRKLVFMEYVHVEIMIDNILQKL